MLHIVIVLIEGKKAKSRWLNKFHVLFGTSDKFIMPDIMYFHKSNADQTLYAFNSMFENYTTLLIKIEAVLF